MNIKLNKHDQAFILLVCILAILHYLAWSDYPTDIDPINFTVALRDFAPAFDSPHPPGYPLFVFAARLAVFVVGENHAYQLINLGMLLATGTLLYWLFRRIHETAIGFAAAVLLMTHPLVWAATVTPECYVSDVFFGCTILAFVLARREWRYLLAGIFILFFLLGLVRPVSGAMLLPLAMMAAYTTTRSKSLPFLLAVVVAIAIILAFGITAYISGGLGVYRSAAMRVMGSSFHAHSILGGAPLSAHLKMLSRVFGWWFLLALPMALSLLYVALKKPSNFNFNRYSAAVMIGGAWLLPPLAFYSSIYYQKPTYQLIYLPCLLIPIAWVLYGKDSVFAKNSANWILAGLVIVQLGIFFLPIPQMPQALYRQTEAFVIRQDRAWEQLTTALDALPKNKTLLIWVAHPSLSVYAVRLLDRQSPVAMANSGRSRLYYFEPKTMNWLSMSEAETRVAEKYEGVIIVDTQDGKAIVKYIPLVKQQRREVDNLLKL